MTRVFLHSMINMLFEVRIDVKVPLYVNLLCYNFGVPQNLTAALFPSPAVGAQTCKCLHVLSFSGLIRWYLNSLLHRASEIILKLINLQPLLCTGYAL